MDTIKSCTQSVLPCSFSVSFGHQSVAIVMGLVRLSQPAYGRMGFQLALVYTLKHARDAGKIASREAMCAMKQLSLPVISWG